MPLKQQSPLADVCGHPVLHHAGLPKRDYRAKPYGLLGTDFYANRNAFLEAFDYDFYHMFLSNNGSGHPDKASLGNFGLGDFSGKGHAKYPVLSHLLHAWMPCGC
jgi:hypothetical protein